MDESTKAWAILTNLQNHNFSKIDRLFSDYLHPISTLIPSERGIDEATKPYSPSLIRSLAKTFHPFLRQAISLLTKILSQFPTPPEVTKFTDQLLQCYRLCLDSLDNMSSELSGKPYSILLQRAKFLPCLRMCGRYDAAICEGFEVLKGLSGVKFQHCQFEIEMGSVLPCLRGSGEGLDVDYVHLIVNVALSIAECVSLCKTKDAKKYTGLLILLHEVKPWFRYLDSSAHSKLQWKLLTSLRNATKFLIKDVKEFEGDLVPDFFSATLDEYTGLLNGHNQGRMGNLLADFAAFVSGSAYSARKSVQNALAEHLFKSAANISRDLTILRLTLKLYAMGLWISEFNLQLVCSCTAESEGWKKLQDLSILLEEFYRSNEACASSSDDDLSFYLNALKFICTRLAESINSERERIVSAEVKFPLENNLEIILKTFFEYLQRSSFHRHNQLCSRENDANEEIDKAVISIFVACFTLSLKLNINTKESRRFMKCLLEDEFIFSMQHTRWKTMISLLYSISMDFHSNNQCKKAIKALKLCCKASWNHCLLLCKNPEGKMKRLDEQLCETMIVDSVYEACIINSRLLHILHQSAKDKLGKAMVCSVEKWCHARSVFEKLPSPNSLLKSWVKIQCKLHEKTETSALILGSCLVDFTYISLETVPIFLELELSAYQEMSSRYPKFSQRMQMDILDILLRDHYSKKCIQRSLTLVKKGRLLRANGVRSLENCKLCLSEAIEVGESNMRGSYAATHKEASSISCQLAAAYCLRALCTQESNPNSKEVLGDVHMALNLWSMTDVYDLSWNGQRDMGFEYVRLLYHISDLLSMKGDILQLRVVKVITKIFKQMNVPLEKCLSLLWGCRRLNHALCVVPINEALIMSLSECYGKDAESLDFWFSSLKDSPALSYGLQQNFSFLRLLFPVAFDELRHSIQADISIDKVRGDASEIISNVSKHGNSVFLDGYLLYDLSESLSASGHMAEALVYAKEAHRLRDKLFHKYFSVSFEQSEEKHGEPGETMQKQSPCVGHLSISDSMATCAWPNSVISGDSDGYILTSWSVLRCFLESILQVGLILETLGNGAQAEYFFKRGKSVSWLQNLPLFTATFSSYLGKLFLGKNQLDLADKEWQSAEQVLAIENDSTTCSGCLLMLEITIKEQRGNLYRKGVNCVTRSPYESALESIIPLEEGGLPVWLDQGNSPKVVVQNKVTKDYKPATRGVVAKRKALVRSVPLDKENSPKVVLQNQVTKDYRPVTRGMVAKQKASALSCTRVSSGAETVKTKAQGRESSRRETSKSLSIDKCYAAAPNTRTEHVSIGNSRGILENGKACFPDILNCQKCFSDVLRNCGQFTRLLRLKREFIRRRQILRLLIGLGKCQVASAEAHKIFSKGISILMRGTNCECFSSLPLKLDLIGKEEVGNILAYEQAEVIYHFCWFSLKALDSDDIRCLHSDVCSIQMPEIISFLKLSFVRSREMPLLFQKVSMLLALVYVFTALKENPSSSLSSCQMRSENEWAAYFHEMAAGVFYNVQLLTDGFQDEVQMASKIKGAEATSLSSTKNAPHTFLRRIIPTSVKEIDACVANFFQILPSTTIVSISLLKGSYARILKELIPLDFCPHGWILLSHLNGDHQPAVVLLPLSSVEANSDEETSSGCSIFEEKNLLKEWCCPWNCNVAVDNVAPLFKRILRGNYVSSSSYPKDEDSESIKTWWTGRVSLNNSLRRFVRGMEDLWFGPWKFLLCGKWLDCEPLDLAAKKLVHEIKVVHGSVVKESIIKIVMGGVNSRNLEEIPCKFLEKGCYIGRVKAGGQERCSALEDAVHRSMLAAFNELEANCCTRREPVILVLDNDIQMLPWENMPILREQEVYRMPSVASVFVALQRRCFLQEAVRVPATFPLIDPLDAFYLLNPSSEFPDTQKNFEGWFRSQNIQGIAGIVPKTEELVAALQNHDLFLYFDHGSGNQYIPKHKIKKLENCAATLLMGCSSASLTLNGQYSPTGVWLSYIQAGSPIVVGNLWDVTDRDIDRFAKAVLEFFMDARESLDVNKKRGNAKKGQGKKKQVTKAIPDISGGYCTRHKLRAGYFVSQAREVCKLPYLIGAAPVCYGVPTGMKIKTEI